MVRWNPAHAKSSVNCVCMPSFMRLIARDSASREDIIIQIFIRKICIKEGEKGGKKKKRKNIPARIIPQNFSLGEINQNRKRKGGGGENKEGGGGEEKTKERGGEEKTKERGREKTKERGGENKGKGGEKTKERGGEKTKERGGRENKGKGGGGGENKGKGGGGGRRKQRKGGREEKTKGKKKREREKKKEILSEKLNQQHSGWETRALTMDTWFLYAFVYGELESFLPTRGIISGGLASHSKKFSFKLVQNCGRS